VRRLALLVGVWTLPLAACGSDDDPVQSAVDDVVQPIVTAVQDGLVGIDESKSLACDAERTTLATALEAKQLLDGAVDVTEDALVPDFLRGPSELFDIVDGQVVPAPGSPCT
jgi:hypothetical protein